MCGRSRAALTMHKHTGLAAAARPWRGWPTVRGALDKRAPSRRSGRASGHGGLSGLPLRSGRSGFSHRHVLADYSLSSNAGLHSAASRMPMSDLSARWPMFHSSAVSGWSAFAVVTLPSQGQRLVAGGAKPSGPCFPRALSGAVGRSAAAAYAGLACFKGPASARPWPASGCPGRHRPAIRSDRTPGSAVAGGFAPVSVPSICTGYTTYPISGYSTAASAGVLAGARSSDLSAAQGGRSPRALRASRAAARTFAAKSAARASVMHRLARP